MAFSPQVVERNARIAGVRETHMSPTSAFRQRHLFRQSSPRSRNIGLLPSEVNKQLARREQSLATPGGAAGVGQIRLRRPVRRARLVFGGAQA
jgi:hypothetical protein